MKARDIEKCLRECMASGDIERVGERGELKYRLSAQGKVRAENLIIDMTAGLIRWAAPSHEIVTGEDGLGLYVYNSEYPEEGALFLAPVSMREAVKVARVIVDEEVKAGCWE